MFVGLQFENFRKGDYSTDIVNTVTIDTVLGMVVGPQFEYFRKGDYTTDIVNTTTIDTVL